MNNKQPILLGSAFPMSLVRRKVVIEPHPLAELKELVATRPVVSFWGHANTMDAAEAMLGVSIKPSRPRPAVTLDEHGFPQLDGHVFSVCWIVSPEYNAGYRPAVGGEVPPSEITGWQVLCLEWER